MISRDNELSLRKWCVWGCVWLFSFFQINEETYMIALLGKDQYSPKFVQMKVSQSEVSDL